jgi:hypothetical protein
MSGYTLFKNHPFPDSVEWSYQDKDTYLEIEKLFTDNVVFFKPFLVKDFYPQEMFDEIVEICTGNRLDNIDFSNQMNKWEEGVPLPQKFIDYAVSKAKELIGTQDIQFGYHMYAHHQITSDDRKPMLPLHIDWSPGSYMIDLHIGGNRDWAFVAGFEDFVCEPNQAIICQPQFDYHFRPSWASEDPDEFYQALFFHLINDSHWYVPNNASSTRDPMLDEKYQLGKDFRETDVFKNFQMQRRRLFDEIYMKQADSLAKQGKMSPIPYDDVPSSEDANIHERKNVTPKAKNSSVG